MGDPTGAPSFVRDGGRFDAFQRRVAAEILRVVRKELEEAGVKPPRLHEAMMSLAFNVCAIVDGSAVMEDRNRPVVPVLCFFESREESDKLILDIAGVGSYMHEIVGELSDELFADDDDSQR
jgi:hypothetical protein